MDHSGGEYSRLYLSLGVQLNEVEDKIMASMENYCIGIGGKVVRLDDRYGVLGILPPNIAIRPASHGWRDL